MTMLPGCRITASSLTVVELVAEEAGSHRGGSVSYIRRSPL
jgi:hypothetical protein